MSVVPVWSHRMPLVPNVVTRLPVLLRRTATPLRWPPTVLRAVPTRRVPPRLPLASMSSCGNATPPANETVARVPLPHVDGVEPFSHVCSNTYGFDNSSLYSV